MIDRKPIVPTTYDQIGDELLRSDLQALSAKLKREVLDKEIRLQMPIGLFEKRWLNLFIGKVDGEDQPYGFPVVRWINEVTTNPYTWVDIMLPDGTVAYSVPPLLNTKGVQVNHVDFFHHIMELQAMADHGAPMGEMERYRQKHIMQFIGHDENADTFITEINKMAMFHGYAPFTSMDGVSLTPTGGVATKQDDSVGFGEDVRVDDF